MSKRADGNRAEIVDDSVKREPRWEVRQGHVLDVLRTMAAESVHCVVTSPPYWGLRIYDTEPQVWGGVAGCTHDWVEVTRPEAKRPSRSVACRLCGAWRGELGTELTPDLYLDHVVEVFREVRRVLRRDGTLWFNIADTYGSGRGLSQKNLCLIPERAILALQQDGWIVRSRIAWCKSSAMPESVKDRPTSGWDYIFLLSKARRYFYDAGAVRTPFAESSLWRITQPRFQQQLGGSKDPLHYNGQDGGEQNRSARRALNNLAEKLVRQERWKGRTVGWKNQVSKLRTRESLNANWDAAEVAGSLLPGANLRNFWVLGNEPFLDTHFSVFPTMIPRIAILASTSAYGVCAECGAPWRRVLNDVSPLMAPGSKWEPTCRHREALVVPATVLDPFLGSGTSVAVAKELDRNGIGIELSAQYCAMAEGRIAGTQAGLRGLAV